MHRPAYAEPMRFDAIVLAGGRARRLDGVDKPNLLVGGRRLIDVALDAVAGAAHIVVVGPFRDLPEAVIQTREDPPFAGPAAAVAAGLAALDAHVPAPGSARPVVLLASDLPAVTADTVAALLAALVRTGAPVVLGIDPAGRRQYLLSAWSVPALRSALADHDGPSMRALVPDGAVTLALTGTADIDTPADHRAATDPRPDPLRAAELLRAELTPLAVRTVAADDAVGATLADPLVAVEPFPPFDAAAMDGYAVAGPGPWRLTGPPRAAGGPGGPPLSAGQAVPIATGAPLPESADRSIRHEDTSVGEDAAMLRETGPGRDDTRRRAETWAAGDPLAPAGTRVDPAVCSVARSAGTTRLSVRGPVRAVVYSSGDEIVTTGVPGPGRLPDTASGPVAAALRDRGVTTRIGGHLPDDAEAVTAALRQSDADLVVVVGGTGHGVADQLRTVGATLGARWLLDGIAVRPGGSLLVAQLPDDTVLLGLGGNPLAAVAGVALTVPALVDGLTRSTPAPAELIEVHGADPHPRFWRVVPVAADGAGGWSAAPGYGTGQLRAMLGHPGLALLPPAGDLEKPRKLT